MGGDMKHFISLGAGVQSSTMALMAAAGEITPMPDGAIFADTGYEPLSVYKWLNWLEKQLPFPVYCVGHNKDMRQEALARRVSRKTGNRYVKSVVPAWFKNPNGSRGAGSRRCTRDYKIRVIRRTAKKLLGLKGRLPRRQVATSWIGISTDEAHRMKPTGEIWIENTWPLIDKGLSRSDCKVWMKAAGYPEPPRSACYFCPYHGAEEWLRLKRTEPEEFQKAVEFERELQTVLAEHDEVTKGVPFLWPGLTPLDQTDFEDAPGQPDLFGNECEGMCGV